MCTLYWNFAAQWYSMTSKPKTIKYSSVVHSNVTQSPDSMLFRLFKPHQRSSELTGWVSRNEAQMSNKAFLNHPCARKSECANWKNYSELYNSCTEVVGEIRPFALHKSSAACWVQIWTWHDGHAHISVRGCAAKYGWGRISHSTTVFSVLLKFFPCNIFVI